MKTFVILILLFLNQMNLGAESPHPKVDIVIAALKEKNINLENIRIEKQSEKSPFPNCYEERVAFSLKSVAPKGGQLFVFSKKKYGDSVYAYFETIKGIAGPYLYQSKDGLVVAQLNSGLTVAEAEKIEEALKSFELPASK